MKKYIILLWLALVANVVQGQQIVRQVQTLADLANVADGFQSLYNVQYGYIEGDGLGGVFFYDSNGAASTNIFNVIDSNIIAGQWVRSDTSQKELRLSDANNSDYTGFQAPSVLAADVVYTLPSSDGAAGTVLSTDGALGLSWASAAALSSDTLAGINGTKLVSPALYFDGVNDYVEVADDDKLSFTDGTDDLPFSISAFVKMEDATNFPILSKYGTTSGTREWRFEVDSVDKARLYLRSSGTVDSSSGRADAALTSYEGQWVHIAATYAGTSGGVFTNAADSIQIYVNGVAVATTAANNEGGTYAGMSDTSQAVWVGRLDNTYAEGHIRNVQIFNRELTADEVAQLARGNDLGFADEWGGATATSGTLTVGKRYRLRDWITGDDFTNVGAGSNADGVEFIATGTTPATWSNSSVVENIGTVLDARAERYDTSTNKLYDLSSNNYIGVNSGVTLTGREVPVYETGTWTPAITFGGGSTGITYTTQEGHYTRYGNWVSVHAYILLSAKGSDTGTALITGLPFTARNTTASSHSLSIGNMANAANLTSAVTAYATDNGTTINLVDWGATGSAVLDDTNFGATTAISVTGIYQIQ